MPDEVKPIKYPILEHFEVPEAVLKSWQITVDLLAKIANIPAALIMRVHEKEIEVFVSSQSAGNVYHQGEKAPLDFGLYCETVMNTQHELLVPNALKDPLWEKNPDIKLGMISYCGLPLTWPGGEIFGTICILDNQEHFYTSEIRDLLERFRDSVQFSLEAIYQSSLEHERADEAMKEQNSTLRSAFDSTNAHIFSLDRQYLYTSFNKSHAGVMKAIYGVEIEIGHSLFDYQTVPEDREKEKRNIDRALVGEKFIESAYSGEEKLARKYFEISHNPVIAEDGAVIGVVVFSQDITHRKQMEDELHRNIVLSEQSRKTMLSILEDQKRSEDLIRKSEEKYRTLLQTAMDGFWLADVKGNLLQVNESYCRMSGYTEQELLTMHITDLDSAETADATAAHIKTIMTKGEDRFETKHCKKDGSLFDVEVNVQFKDIEGGRFIVFLQDITQRKRASKISEARLRLMQFASTHSLDELLQSIIDESETLTGSSIGFHHFLAADQRTLILQTWSTNTLKAMCKAEGKGLHYDVDKAGVWVDCVHERRPVIHNDYPALPASHRKGMPEGHAPVTRELVVPVFRGERIVSILGVGNKPRDYDQNDVEIASRLADLAWDITESKRAEEALKKYLEKYQVFFDMLPIGVTVSDKDGNIIESNEESIKLLGLSKEEQERRRISGEEWIIIRPDGSPMPESEYASVIALKENRLVKNVEMGIVKGKNEIIWINVTAAPISLDGSVAIVYGDITERKKAEDALQSASLYNRTLIEASIDPLVTIGKDGKITDVNASTENITGYNRDDLIGTDFSDYFTEPESARAGYRQVFTSGSVYDYPLEIRNRNGNTTSVLYNATVYKDDNGNVVGVFAAAHDITERKRAEEEIRELNAGLEERIANRTAQLEEANKELEAFSYSVSHDLRAPLRHINGFIEILQDRIKTTLDDQSRHYMEVIARSAKTMGALIDDLLSFSRMGRAEMSKSKVELNTLVQDVIKEFNAETKERDIRWKISLLPVVTGDHAMLRMVLVNLISNALKYTRTRKIAEIEIGYEVQGEAETVIFIRDNGVGFDMNYANKLFGVFQRMHRSDEFEGTGIGLANVRRIIQRHDGRTWAEAKLDGGAIFYFSLPCK